MVNLCKLFESGGTSQPGKEWGSEAFSHDKQQPWPKHTHHWSGCMHARTHTHTSAVKPERGWTAVWGGGSPLHQCAHTHTPSSLSLSLSPSLLSGFRLPLHLLALCLWSEPLPPFRLTSCLDALMCLTPLSKSTLTALLWQPCLLLLSPLNCKWFHNKEANSFREELQ